jgi:hypothetical protein
MIPYTWWLSFGDGNEFKGVILVDARTVDEAVCMINNFGVHPGGVVQAAYLLDPNDRLTVQCYRSMQRLRRYDEVELLRLSAEKVYVQAS